MRNTLGSDESDPDVRAAIDDALSLVVQSRGSNLDPIIDALDERLRTRAGEINPIVITHLRPSLSDRIDDASARLASGQQLAGRLLGGVDGDAFSLLAAADRDIAALVPLLARCLFTQMTPTTWAVASALAALVAVQGVSAVRPTMPRPTPNEPLAPAM